MKARNKHIFVFKKKSKNSLRQIKWNEKTSLSSYLVMSLEKNVASKILYTSAFETDRHAKSN